MVGWTKGGNKHSGISIVSDRNYIRMEDMNFIWAPRDADISGRIAAIRVKSGAVDFTVINMYLPPPTGSPIIFRKAFDAVRNFAGRLPSRMFKILCGDFNVKF